MGSEMCIRDSPTLDAGAIAGTEVARNFGVVRESRLYPPQTGQAASPGVVVYAHLYRPGTLGGLTLSLANAPSWTVQVRVDGNCDGDFDDPGEGFASLPQTLPVGPSWPREADGSLKACALEVRVLVPPGVIGPGEGPLEEGHVHGPRGHPGGHEDPHLEGAGL